MKKVIDLTEVLTPDLERKWVALSEDYTEVIGSSEDLLELKKQVNREDVVYLKVPVAGVSYAF